MRSALDLAALSTVISLSLAPIAAGAGCLPGKYAGTGGEEGDQSFPVLVTIDCEGQAVRGQIESPFGEIPISGGDAGAEQWRIEAVSDGVPVTAEARRQGEDWTGTYQLGDERGILTLRRDDAAVFAQLNAEAPENLELTTEQWREDLAFIAEQIPARHANAFHTISEAKWRSAVAELDARLPTLSDEEIPVAFRELVARIGDAHTSVRMPASTGRLPIATFWFGDEMRITATSQAQVALLGARVLRIGHVPVREAARRAARCVAEDNRWAVLASTPYLLRRRDALVYYGLVRAGALARLQLRLANGRTTVVELPFDAGADIDAPFHVGGQAPIWAQNPEQSLWTRELPGSILYVNFRAYDDLRTRTLALMTEIERLQPGKLVLDMRDNGGGDFTLFRESMLAAILERPWLNRRDRLYVLIGRETFSAAMTNAADIRLRTNATLVGEPMGERPNSYQEVRSFNTPNAHLRLGVSIKFYEALPGAGDPEALTPHVSRPPTWERFALGEDDALEWVRRQ